MLNLHQTLQAKYEVSLANTGKQPDCKVKKKLINTEDLVCSVHTN